MQYSINDIISAMSDATAPTVEPDAMVSELAAFASGLRVDDLPAETVEAATRRVVDTLGCGYGGFDNEPARIARAIASESSGVKGASVLGLPGQTSPDMAAYANAVMVRYQDLNDVNKALRMGGHPSDMIPAVLAVADAYQVSGADAVAGVVAAYQGFGAFPVHIKKRGWDQGMLVSVGTAMGVGRVLGLDETQMRNAISMAVVPSIALCVTRRGQLSMWKSAASAAADRNAVFAALLAAKGMTGPGKPFQGQHGLVDQATGEFDLQVDPAEFGYRVGQSDIKRFPACGSTQAVIATVIEMAGDVKPADVEKIDVETHWDTWFETGREPEKWDPQSRETADHSLPFVMATALRDGDVTLGSFTEEAVHDPELRPLMAKITITENPDLTALRPAQTLSDVAITLTSGEVLTARTGIPLGDHRNPLSDAELERKFRGMAERVSTEDRIDVTLASLWKLAEAPDTAQVMGTWASSVAPDA
jgi:2-methylcitrate dehydratase